MLKANNWNVYLPIQKSLKIEPKISSTSTLPTIIPKYLVANLKSSAALSKSSKDFFSSKFFKLSKHCSRFILCLSLVIKISSDETNLFFKFSLIKFISTSKFFSSLIEM